MSEAHKGSGFISTIMWQGWHSEMECRSRREPAVGAAKPGGLSAQVTTIFCSAAESLFSPWMK